MNTTTRPAESNARPRGSRVRVSAAALAAAALLLGAVAPLAGCRGDRSGKPPRQFFPDLDDQPKVKEQVKSTFFTEFEPEEYGEEEWGRAARLPVTGTVPFGRWAIVEDELMGVDFAQRESFVALDVALNEGVGPAGRPVEDIPAEVTAELLALGQKKYNIYCIACHGGAGEGDGLVGVRWSAPIPSYHEDRYQKGAVDDEGELLLTGLDGHLYDVIRNGVANPPGVEPALRMPAYGDKVSPRESWAIVAYIRALQMTRQGELDMLDAADRERLRAQLPADSNTPDPDINGGDAALRTADAGGQR